MQQRARNAFWLRMEEFTREQAQPDAHDQGHGKHEASALPGCLLSAEESRLL